jgi:hypothetical protein
VRKRKMHSGRIRAETMIRVSGSNTASPTFCSAAVSVGVYFAIHLGLSIVDLDLQHRKSALQIPRTVLDPLFRREFGLHTTIDDDGITAAR